MEENLIKELNSIKEITNNFENFPELEKLYNFLEENKLLAFLNTHIVGL